MACKFLRESIKENTSKSMVNYILFVDSHHNGNLSHEDTIKKYKGTELGSYIDFDKMERLIKEKSIEDNRIKVLREIARITPVSTPVSMDYVLDNLYGKELTEKLRTLFA